VLSSDRSLECHHRNINSLMRPEDHVANPLKETTTGSPIAKRARMRIITSPKHPIQPTPKRYEALRLV